jgi:hypothetical protein
MILPMRPARQPHHNRAIAAIALFKFVKSALLVAAAVAAWRLMNPDINAALRTWAAALPLGLPERLARHGLAYISGIPAHRWRELGFVSLAFAAVLATEGIGLWHEKVWAEYLTVATTAAALPFELIEVVDRFTPARVGVLTANAAVVAYLLVRARRRHQARR